MEGLPDKVSVKNRQWTSVKDSGQMLSGLGTVNTSRKKKKFRMNIGNDKIKRIVVGILLELCFSISTLNRRFLEQFLELKKLQIRYGSNDTNYD